MSIPHPLTLVAYQMNDRASEIEYIATRKNEVLSFHGWQHFNFGDNDWIAANCQDPKTGLAFAIHPNNINLLIRKK